MQHTDAGRGGAARNGQNGQPNSWVIASLGQIVWEQLVLGYPEFGIRFEQRPDFAPWAEAYSGWGIRVDRADEVEGAIAEALAYPGPALSDVTVDPDEPPMPGTVQYEQAKGFAKAFLAGQPRRATIASTPLAKHDLRAPVMNKIIGPPRAVPTPH